MNHTRGTMIATVLLLAFATCTFCFDPQTTIEWKTCAKRTASVSAIQCATIQVPLLWDKPSDNRSVDLFVRRVSCKQQTPRKGQLWLLNGLKTPMDGSSLYTKTESICKSLPGYDIMIPDHRGIGKSTRIGSTCQKKKIKFAECYEDLKQEYTTEGLRGFGLTNAARDVLHFAANSKTSGDKIVILGIAYGTLWLNRILQISPDTVDMAIADTVISPSFEASSVDDLYNTVGTQLLSMCEANNDCISHFTSTGSLSDQITAILNKQDTANACTGRHRKASNIQKFSSKRLRKLYAGMLREIPLTKLILPSLVRLNRCDNQDKIWLQNLGYSLGISTIANGNFYTPTNSTTSEELLYYLIAGSELSSDPIPLSGDQWVQKYSTIPPFFHRNESPTAVYKLSVLIGDRYQESLRGSLATNYSNPLLILHGTLSPVAPRYMGEEWQTHFAGNQTHFVWANNAQTGVVFNTPVSTAVNAKVAGLTLALDWIKSDGDVVNATTITEWLHNSYNFNSSAKASAVVAYTKSLWTGSASKTKQQSQFIKITRSLTIGLGILFITTVAFILLMLVDGTLCKALSERSSKKYLNLETKA